MSLSFWLRDYLYYPLSRARVLSRFRPSNRAIAALVVTMLVCGLWHGADWHYVGLGVALGLSLVVDRILTVNLWRREMPSWLRIGGGWAQTQTMVMIFIVLFPNSLWGAAHLWQHMIVGGLSFHILTPAPVLEVLAIFGATAAMQLVLRRWPLRQMIANFEGSAVLRPAYAFSLSLVALYFAVANVALTVGPQRFIYFQF